MSNSQITVINPKTPAVNSDGTLKWELLKTLQDWQTRINSGLGQLGELVGTFKGLIDAQAKIQGRTEGIGTTVQNLDASGIVKDNGIDLARNYQNKTFSNINGTVASAQQAINAPTNTTNYCTVDSVDNGVSATIRVYGAATGVGTVWTRQVGSLLKGPYPALLQPGMAYSTTYYVMLDPTSNVFSVSTSFADSLADNLIFCGKVTTVAAGGGGGTSGGGGTGGGTGGACFSGNVGVVTPEGIVKFRDLPEFFIAKTRRGWRAAQRQKHFYDGVMHDMGGGRYVTPGHPFAHEDGWIPAREKYLSKVLFDGYVFNATIQTDCDEEREYTLDSGEVVHNMSLA